MSNWNYIGTIVKDINFFPNNCIGFIYMINDDKGKSYIGKKSLYSETWKPVSKKVYDKALEDKETVKKTRDKKLSKKGLPVWIYKKKTVKESNWKDYKSSHKELSKKNNLEKYILELAYSKLQLTYLETKYMFKHNVLESDDFYNGNILGKFYRGINQIKV